MSRTGDVLTGFHFGAHRVIGGRELEQARDPGVLKEIARDGLGRSLARLVVSKYMKESEGQNPGDLLMDIDIYVLDRDGISRLVAAIYEDIEAKLDQQNDA